MEWATRIQAMSTWIIAAAGLVATVTGILSSHASNVLDRETDRQISQANVIAAEAKKESSQADATAAQATQRAEETRKQNLQLQLQLEAERKARLEIEKKMAPRTLEPDQVSTMSEILKKSPPFAVACGAILGDQEAISFAKQLTAVFDAHGYATDQGFAQVACMQPMHRVNVSIPDQSFQAHGILVAQVLSSIGLPLNLIIDPEMGKFVQIIVGAKPV
ncbi:hypothetical protein WAE61_06340 [Comamonadaceae bacterium PP-2]